MERFTTAADDLDCCNTGDVLVFVGWQVAPFNSLALDFACSLCSSEFFPNGDALAANKQQDEIRLSVVQPNVKRISNYLSIC